MNLWCEKCSEPSTHLQHNGKLSIVTLFRNAKDVTTQEMLLKSTL